jgi:multiple sugar transport system substrate-binding protein
LRLAWWGNPTRDAKTEAAADMYMEQNPNVQIELETVGWGGYWDRIATQAAAQSLPDIMQHDYSQIYDWVQRGLLADLTPYIRSGVIDTSNIASSFLDGGRFSGGIYGISLGTNALCVAYDTDVLAQAGVALPDTATWTWDDFVDMAIEVYDATGVKVMPIFNGDPRHGIENMLIQMGDSIFAADGNSLGFTDDSVLREYFEINLRLLDAGVMVDPELAFLQVTPDEGQLAQGNTWVEWIWSNQLASTQSVTTDTMTIGLMPSLDGAEQPGTYLKPSMFFSITSQAENPDEAARFINFFVNDVTLNTEVLTAERGVPIPSNVRQAVGQNVDAVNRRVFDFIALAGANSSPIPLPDPEGAAEVVDLIRQTTIQVLEGDLTVDEGIDQIMSEGNAILAD